MNDTTNATQRAAWRGLIDDLAAGGGFIDAPAADRGPSGIESGRGGLCCG